MRKIVFNKKFIAAVSVCLAVAGGMAVKFHVNTKASDNSLRINGMSVIIQQCEGQSEEIMDEDVDETISQEVIALEEQGHSYEFGDVVDTSHGEFIPMVKEIDNETAYNAFGGITSKSGNNYVIVVKSEKEISEADLEKVASVVKEQVK